MEILNTITLFVLLIITPLAWLLPERWQLTIVSLLTAGFMAYFVPVSAGTLLVTALISFWLFDNGRIAPSLALKLNIGLIVLVWFVFKTEWPAHTFTWIGIGLPLGLSYYSFRQIHYAIERSRNVLPAHTLKDYLHYLFFLPMLLVGPISRFPDFLRESRRRRWDATRFSMGLQRVLYGYVKVATLGNYLLSFKALGPVEALKMSNPSLGEYVDIWRWVGNAYVQFAGYSDIAVGLSLLLGVRIAENFMSPFLASDLNEFWKRYHMSLSSWCRDYIFTPILSLTRRPTVAVITSMLVLGVWHEWTQRYLVWGALQGIGIILWHRYQPVVGRWEVTSRFPKLTWLTGMLLTTHFFTFSCIVLREDEWSGVWRTVTTLFS